MRKVRHSRLQQRKEDHGKGGKSTERLVLVVDERYECGPIYVGFLLSQLGMPFYLKLPSLLSLSTTIG